MTGGIGRRSSCLKWDLSGKPTFMSVLLNDGWVTANDPKQAHKKTTRRCFGCFLVARGGIEPGPRNPNLASKSILFYNSG